MRRGNRKAPLSLPYKFKARDYQRAVMTFMHRGGKRGFCVWHRRSGKDKTFINIMIKEMVRRVGGYYYIFPTYKQAMKTIWKGRDRDGFAFLDHFPKKLIDIGPNGKPMINHTEMSITFKNGSYFQLIGSDKFDSIRGPNPVGIVFSEYGYQDPRVFDVLRPIIRENDGWAIFNTTPCGDNHAKDLYDMAKDNPNWFCEILTVDDTKIVFTPEMIEEDIAEGMSADMVEQEYYCSFDAGIHGAYYAKQYKQAQEEGRIVERLPVLPGYDVDTYWDLGIDDSMSIWFVQDVDNQCRFLDYYENNNEGLKYYFDMLEEKAAKRGFHYGTHYWPHDGSQRELSTGKTRFEAAYEMGYEVHITTRPKKKEDAIEQCRQHWKFCVFDAGHCEFGLKALRNFKKLYNDVMKRYMDVPLKDWSMHAADAFQTFSISHYWLKDVSEVVKALADVDPLSIQGVLAREKAVADRQNQFEEENLDAAFY